MECCRLLVLLVVRVRNTISMFLVVKVKEALEHVGVNCGSDHKTWEICAHQIKWETQLSMRLRQLTSKIVSNLYLIWDKILLRCLFKVVVYVV